MRKRLAILFLLVAGFVQAADEVTITTFFKVQNGDFDLTRNIANLKRDQTGRDSAQGIITVSTSTTIVPVNTDVAIAGYTFFRNVGTNDITVNNCILLKPSDIALLRLSTTNVTAITTNLSSRLEYWINEE